MFCASQQLCWLLHYSHVLHGWVPSANMVGHPASIVQQRMVPHSSLVGQGDSPQHNDLCGRCFSVFRRFHVFNKLCRLYSITVYVPYKISLLLVSQNSNIFSNQKRRSLLIEAGTSRLLSLTLTLLCQIIHIFQSCYQIRREESSH